MNGLGSGANRGLDEAVDRIVFDWQGSLKVCVQRCVILALVVICSVAVEVSARGDWYGDDEGVRRYGLRNGLEVVVVPSDGATFGREFESVQIWLSVVGGMLDEGEDERGASHLAGEMLRGGVDRFAREDVRAMLLTSEEMAEQDELVRGVQVGLDRTLFMGHATSGDADAMASVLEYYSSVLEPDDWEFDTEEFENDRAWLRGRVEGAMQPEMVARQRWLGRLFGDGTLGTRLPLPERSEVDALTAGRVKSYAQRVYRPSRAVVMVIGNPGGIDLDAMIAERLGMLGVEGHAEVADASAGIGGERVIFEQEPGWSMHQAVLIWTDLESQKALQRDVSMGFTGDEIQAYVTQRVAEEVIRRRVERLGIARFGADGVLSVDRFEIGPNLALMQFLIQREDGSDGDQAWTDSIELLIEESMRLVRHGAVREEVVQARGALLAQWHRSVESARTMSSRDRAGNVNWLVSTGRPVMSAERWDLVATRMMSSISDDAVNTEIGQLIDPARMSVLVSRGGDRSESAAKEHMLESLVEELASRPVAALDAQWMRSLGGDLLDERALSGTVERVTQHAPSGTWGGVLGNGVRLWVREVDEPGVVEVQAMLSGAMFQDGSLSEPEIESAMLAWRYPGTEDRDLGWVAVFMETHRLELEAEREVGGVRLRVRCSADEADKAVELVYAMLSRPMIDEERFKRWAKGEPKQYGDGDPLDRGLAMLFRPELLVGDERDVARDDAQRVLARMTLSSQVEIAIAGDVDAPAMLERGGELFGMLSDRVRLDQYSAQPADEIRLQQRTVRVDGDERMMLTGVVVGRMDDLADLRTGVVASRLVTKAARRALEANGVTGVNLGTQVIMSDALGDNWVFVLQVRGDSLEQGERVLRETIEQIVIEGTDADDLEADLLALENALDGGFGRSRYWATRMCLMGVHSRSMDDLWTIREAYAAVDVDEVDSLLRGLMARSDWFRIEVDPDTVGAGE